jgi:hypothetical protein
LSGKPSVAQKSDDGKSIFARVAANSGRRLGFIMKVNCVKFAVAVTGQFQQLYLNILYSENTNLPDTGAVRQFLKQVILNRSGAFERLELPWIVKHCHTLKE